MEWQFEDARDRLEELLARTLPEGTQSIRYRDQVIVLISEREYESLIQSHIGLTAVCETLVPGLASGRTQCAPTPERIIELDACRGDNRSGSCSKDAIFDGPDLSGVNLERDPSQMRECQS